MCPERPYTKYRITRDGQNPMASMRSRLLVAATRLFMKLKSKDLGDVRKQRENLAVMDKLGNIPDGITLQDQDDPRPGRWIKYTGAKRTILYLHGGAFVLRLPNSHSSMVAQICAACDANAFLPWYRLAPEDPFPAAPEDCLLAYRYLLESGHKAKDIVVMGDSAGGNLALSLIHLIKRNNLEMPGAAVMLSPVIDFAQISATWRLNTKSDPIYPLNAVVNPARHYLQGSSPIDPIASPVYGNYAGFPPLLFVVGSIEVLVDDSVGAVKKAIEHGVRANVHIWRGLPHVFMLKPFIPETNLAIDKIVDWLQTLETPKPKEKLYRTCVEVFNRRPLTGGLERSTNDLYLDHCDQI